MRRKITSEESQVTRRYLSALHNILDIMTKELYYLFIYFRMETSYKNK